MCQTKILNELKNSCVLLLLRYFVQPKSCSECKALSNCEVLEQYIILHDEGGYRADSFLPHFVLIVN